MEFIVGLDVETWRLILLGVLAVFLMASLLSGYPVAFTLGGASVLVALVGSTMFVLDVQNPPWGLIQTTCQMTLWQAIIYPVCLIPRI